MMARGTKDFVVDLERCPTMDSTFLGTLTGAALGLRETGGGRLSILNANQRNQQLLTSLGLDYILELDRDGTAWLDERRQVGAQLAQCDDAHKSTCKEQQALHVLEAHQALTEANPANACRFRDVIQFLQEELEGKAGVSSA